MKFLHLTTRIELRLDTERAERIRELTGFDVYHLPGNAEGFAPLVQNPKLFLDVLWEMMDHSQITRAGFEALLREAGSDDDRQEITENLWQAFAEECGDFFHDATTKEIIEALVVETRKRWETHSQTILQNVFKNSQSSVGETSGNSQESSVSIPLDSHYVSSTTWLQESSELSGVGLAP